MRGEKKEVRCVYVSSMLFLAKKEEEGVRNEIVVGSKDVRGKKVRNKSKKWIEV